MKIERTLFWFQDENEQLSYLTENFFGLSTLLNRLLNEKYDGKKIKFINLYFYTDKTFDLYPSLPKNEPYYFGGHLKFYGSFEMNEFINLTHWQKINFIWEMSYKNLKKSAEFLKNKELLSATKYAFNKGLEISLNTDLRIIDKKISIDNRKLEVSLCIVFTKEEMISKLIIREHNEIIFEKDIDKTNNGVEFFLEMYKDITFDNSNIILSGRKDVEYLPLKIPISQFILSK